jgi:hypothetical protein
MCYLRSDNEFPPRAPKVAEIIHSNLERKNSRTYDGEFEAPALQFRVSSSEEIV